MPSVAIGSKALPSDAPKRTKPALRPRPEVLELKTWSQPGLCTSGSDADTVRRTLKERFRTRDLGTSGKLYVDPRLAENAEQPVVLAIGAAEQIVGARLGLKPEPPETFVYFDSELLQKSACVNGAVVAYYDGALHVVPSDPELALSVTHEYAHHALMRFGTRGPAWAQEGIAMLVADERWWLDPERLRAVVDSPISIDDMEASIPYKLSEENAVSFYVQAALLVSCLMRRENTDLKGIATAFRSGSPDIPKWLAAAHDLSLATCLQ